MAPDFMNKEKYKKAADVFSLPDAVQVLCVVRGEPFGAVQISQADLSTALAGTALRRPRR